MASYFDAIAGAARQAACKILDAPAAAIELSKKVYGLGSQTPPYNLPRTIQKLICNNPPIDPYVPPFQGGQCPVKYNINWTARDKPIDDVVRNTSGITPVWGPVLGFSYVTDPGYSRPNRYQVQCFGSANNTAPTSSPVFLDITSSIYASTRNPLFAVTITSVVRQDGQPDNCGNPPPITAPPFNPGDNITNITTNYTDNFGNNVNLTVPIAIGYFHVDINGNFNIPFNVQVDPTLNITGNINLGDGGITFNFGGDGNGNKDLPDPRPDPQPGDKQPVNPPPPQPPDTGKPKPPDPDKKQEQNVIVGALVTTLSIDTPEIGEIFQDVDNPQIFIPDLGLIYFRIDVAGSSGWTTDIKIKNRQQYVPCPELAGAIDVAGTPRPGVNWVITPVYDKKRLPVEFPPSPSPSPTPSPGPSPTPSPTP